MATILYEDFFEAFGMPTRENYNSGNDADSKPKPIEDKEFEYEINLVVINLDKFCVTDIDDEAGEWVIN